MKLPITIAIAATLNPNDIEAADASELDGDEEKTLYYSGTAGKHVRFDVEHAAKAQPLQFETILTRVSEATAKPGRGKKVVSESG